MTFKLIWTCRGSTAEADVSVLPARLAKRSNSTGKTDKLLLPLSLISQGVVCYPQPPKSVFLPNTDQRQTQLVALHRSFVLEVCQLVSIAY